MVGGTVIEVVDCGKKVYVNCVDRPHKRIEECAIYVERNQHSELIGIGDSIWWQGRFAMWTPLKNRMSEDDAERNGLKCGVDYDIEIPRIGFSGVSHPTRSDCEAE